MGREITREREEFGCSSLNSFGVSYTNGRRQEIAKALEQLTSIPVISLMAATHKETMLVPNYPRFV